MSRADRQRLAQVREAIRGNQPDTSRTEGLYPVYVAVIIAGSYGVPAAQQLFRSLDGRWLADNALTPAGMLLVGMGIVLLLALIRFVGRVHGPVVPPLPYLEIVAASPIPRKITLGRSWRLSLGGSIFGGLLLGATTGAGLAIAGAASPALLLPAAVGGGLLGLLVAELWLQGQLSESAREFRPDPSLARGRRNALALLDITSLRRQAASNVTIGGAVLCGDLRTARLDAARPTIHARSVRLRPSRPLVVIARRDLLGFRRAPGASLYGLGLAAAGSAGLMLSLQSPHTPTVAPLLSLVLAYLGFGAWCEGLRLHADNSGTSRMLGLPYRNTAWAHLVMPVSAWVLTSILVNAALSLAGLVSPATFLWTLGIGALLAGSHLMASFRGMAPMGVFGPAGMPAMIFWYARPLLVTLVVGTAMTAWGARIAVPWVAFSWMLLLAGFVVMWGLALVGKRDKRD